LGNLEREQVNKKAGDLDAHLFEEESSKVPRLPATASDAPAKLLTPVDKSSHVSETFRGSQIAQPGGAANFLIILTSSYLA
jgi:hypothetical protein